MIKTETMPAEKARNLNTDALAFMGDAVFEHFIRRMLLGRGISRAERLHKEATRYVSAVAQAEIIRGLFEALTEEEQRHVRRWRNHRFHSKAKNADPMTYKWATAFEALVGYLYLTGDEQRLDWLLEQAASIIDGGEEATCRQERKNTESRSGTSQKNG